jgi:hypothetical protein
MVYILQKLNELLHRCRQDKTREQKQGKNSTSKRENHFKYNAVFETDPNSNRVFDSRK